MPAPPDRDGADAAEPRDADTVPRPPTGAADADHAAPRASDAGAERAVASDDPPFAEAGGGAADPASQEGEGVPAVADGSAALGGARPDETDPSAPELDGADSQAAAGASALAETTAGEADPEPALFAHALRIAEALVFASDRPVTPARLQSALPPGCDAAAVLTALSAARADRPVRLAEVAGGFAFRTAPELAPAITRVVEVPRRLPRAAMETLSIIAYHQPVTRAEIEEIRGASLSQSTLEALLDMALIAPRGHKEVPGRPSLWGTTPRFLEQFGLKALADLPRREELVNEPPTLPLAAPPPRRPPAESPSRDRAEKAEAEAAAAPAEA